MGDGELDQGCKHILGSSLTMHSMTPESAVRAPQVVEGQREMQILTMNHLAAVCVEV